MVQVYMPMGYPLLSGYGFANVIYQGNIARLYTVPTDPRSGAQLFQRRLLTDVSKIRATLGPWARGACKTGLGPRWSTVIWQCIKADIESWWSDALDEWDGFGETSKQAWRDACLYQATYNDRGQIYFGLVRVVANALLHYSGLDWGSAVWGDVDSAAATTWWGKDGTGALTKGKYDDRDAAITYVGSWFWGDEVGNWANTYRSCSTSLSDPAFWYIYGRSFSIGYKRSGNMGSGDLYVDGQLICNIDQYASTPIYQVERLVDLGVRGLHYCVFRKHVNTCNIDFVDVH